jgi:hypothetical protein
LVYIGDVLHKAHRSQPNRLLIIVQPGADGPVRVENHCPDGQIYIDTSVSPFMFVAQA